MFPPSAHARVWFACWPCYRDHMVSPVHHPAVHEALDFIAEVRDIRRAAISDARLIGSTQLETRVRAMLRQGESLPVSGDEFAALPSPLQDHLRDHVEALTRLQVLAREH